MARLKSDYDRSIWARLMAWLREGGSALDERMEEDLDEAAKPHILSPEVMARLEHEQDERNRMNLEKEQQLAERFRLWNKTRGAKWYHRIYSLLAVVICVTLISLLLSTVADLPRFGKEDNPINNEVSERYIEKGVEETGATNLVTGMILNYRAFDTLGESHVLFIAACSVILLLRMTRDDSRTYLEEAAYDRHYEPKDDLILQTATRYLFPILLLFSVYVLLNGHLSPGGGFSGGTVLGAALILYVCAYGSLSIHSFFGHRLYSAIKVSALCLYSLILLYYAFTGANGLPSQMPLGTPGTIFSAGFILPINVAVGFEVACTMFGFYASFRKGDL